MARMTSALESIWNRLTPWRADPGAAWWKLCQASPMDGTANHQTLPLSSDVLNGRRPVMWQTELIEKVTWWSTATRTRLPQKKAQSAPCQDQSHSPPGEDFLRSGCGLTPGMRRQDRTGVWRQSFGTT